MGKVKVIKSGLYTSIQDLGRKALRKYGVPVSGAMDQQSVRLANFLVNNPEGHPVIEITLVGPELQFDEAVNIAITGADLGAKIEGKDVPLNQSLIVKKGEVLTFGKRVSGCRSYIGVAGLVAKQVLGSYSQCEGVTENARLVDGDTFHFASGKQPTVSSTRVKIDPNHVNSSSLEVLMGPEFEDFSMISHLMQNQEFEIGENDRMGCQFRTIQELEHERSIITSQVVPGTVQLTPSGKLIVLMRDAQVTGGYPRVLQLTDQSINRLSQKVLGEKIRFRLV